MQFSNIFHKRPNQKTDKMTNYQDFFKIYSSLPVGVRDEIILVLQDQGPITWKVAYLEIRGNTELGRVIYGKLKELNII